MKKVVYGLIFILIFSNITLAVENAIFSDVSGHWAYDAIEKSVTNNLINGYADSTFRPDNNISVAEFLKIIIKAGGYSLVREGNYIWPDFYIATAKNEKLIYQDEFDNYNRPITRYEAVKIISRFIDLNGVNKSRNIFKDLKEDEKENILKLVKLKIINGYSDKTFRGDNHITRAEAVTIIKRSCEQRKKIISKKTYDFTESLELSNYGAQYSGDGVYSTTRYEIINGELKIYDDGRYSDCNGYKVSGENINVNKITKIIDNVVKEDGYVAVLYVPSKHTINQLIISVGESDDKIQIGGIDFSFTFYEDKKYELARISMNKEFSNDCYLKIEVLKMWDDYSNFLDGEYICESKKEKLKKALEVEFGTLQGKRILEYILQKNELYMAGIGKEKEHVEQKKFGEYIINFYQKEYGTPTFYIAKK